MPRSLGRSFVGGCLGLAIGVLTPAHLTIAGSDAPVQLRPGRHYDEVQLAGNTLNAKRATARSLLGEPISVSIRLQLDPSTFVTPSGSFNSRIIPAYVQAYSDPEQLTTDLELALTKHLLFWTVGAAAIADLLVAAVLWQRQRLRAQLARVELPFDRPSLRFGHMTGCNAGA